MANSYSRLGKNTLLIFIGNVGAKSISFLMLPFYTHWLSVDEYGATDIINVYVNLLLGLVTCCISDAVFIFPKDQPKKKQSAYFTSAIIFSLTSLSVTLIVFKVISIICNYRNISNSFTRNIWFIYGLIVSCFFQQCIQEFTRSIDKIRVYSITGIVLTACTAVWSYFFVPKYGVFGYIIAFITANTMAALYAFIFSGAVKYFSVKAFGLTHCIEMLKLTIPFVPNGIMWWLVGALNRPLMEKHLGMYAIGIFAVANKFPGILTTIFSIFNKPWQISVLEEFGKKNYSLFYNKVFRILVTLLIFCFFIITISSKLIIKIFAAEEFFEAYAYVPILTIGTVFSSIASFVGSNFSASRESKYFLYSTVLGAASSVALNFIFIPLFGIMGAAVSVALSFIVIALLRIINSWKYVHIVNIPIYIAMFFLSLALITVMLIKEMWLYWCLLVLIFGLFGMLNYDLKNDFLKIFEKYKTKLIKKCD